MNTKEAMLQAEVSRLERELAEAKKEKAAIIEYAHRNIEWFNSQFKNGFTEFVEGEVKAYSDLIAFANGPECGGRIINEEV